MIVPEAFLNSSGILTLNMIDSSAVILPRYREKLSDMDYYLKRVLNLEFRNHRNALNRRLDYRRSHEVTLHFEQ